MDPQRRKTRTPVKRRQLPVTATVSYADADPKSYEYCRMLMAERYIHSQRSFSIRELVGLPEFSHVPAPRAEKWCTLDRWVERRKELQEEIRNRVTKALVTEMTQERVDHLRKLISLRTAFDNVGMITNAEGNVEFRLQPKSLEAWVTAKVKLDQHISKIQNTVAAELPQMTAEALVPTDRPTNLPMVLRPRLTEEESLDLALRLRDKRMREDEASVARWKASQAAQVEQTAPAPAPAEEAQPKKKKPPPAGGR